MDVFLSALRQGGWGSGLEGAKINVLSLYKTPNKNMSVCLSVCLQLVVYCVEREFSFVSPYLSFVNICILSGMV